MWICDRLNIPCSSTTHVSTQLLLLIKYLLLLTTVETDEVFVFVHSFIYVCIVLTLPLCSLLIFFSSNV